MYELSRELGFKLVRTHIADYPLSKAEVLAAFPVPPWLSHVGERRFAKLDTLDVNSCLKSDGCISREGGQKIIVREIGRFSGICQNISV